MRVASSVSNSVASAAWDSIMEAVGDGFYSSVLDGIRFQAAGTDFSIPFTFTGTVSSWGSGAPDDVGKAAFASMVGRGVDGHKARMQFFGFKGIGSVADYRFSTDASAPWDELRTFMNTGTTLFLTIGGTKAIWYNYVNVGFNSYYQRKLRA